MIKDYKQIDLDGKQVFVKAILEPPFRMVAAMSDSACFYYVIQGRTKVFAPTTRLMQEAHEGVVLSCGNYLNEYLTDDGELDYCEAIAVHFHPEILKRIYANDFPQFALGANTSNLDHIQKIKTTELIRKYIESLQFYFENPELVNDELIELKLKEIILLLVKTDNATTIQELITRLFSTTSSDFRTVVDTNLYNSCSLSELAALTNLSLSSFKREFKKHYRLPPAQYMKQKRLEKASKLLVGTTMRIADVGYECGFSEPAHFTKSFQALFLASPSEYRGVNKV